MGGMMALKLQKLNEPMLVCNATLGSMIGDCLREAIVLALLENRTVVMIHNGVEHHIEPNKVGDWVYDKCKRVKIDG